MPQATSANASHSTPRSSGVSAEDYPVREYIGAMAAEMAQMARWDGDEALGDALDTVVRLASEPLLTAAGPKTGDAKSARS